MKTTAERIYFRHRPFVKLSTPTETFLCPVGEFFAGAVFILEDRATYKPDVQTILTIQTPYKSYTLFNWTLSDYETFLKENNF